MDEVHCGGGSFGLQGAMTGPRPRMMVGAVPGPKTTEIRTINDVLVEPGKDVAPTKRRRGKAKRNTCLKPQGKIRQYFSDDNSPYNGDLFFITFHFTFPVKTNCCIEYYINHVFD